VAEDAELQARMTTEMQEAVKRFQSLQAEIQQTNIDGPVYRQTPILGRFRWYRRFRVWKLRRQLSV
jgi:hypothetical protein